eukprot:6184922-Pleurochrysis_carterae.AAC.1
MRAHTRSTATAMPFHVPAVSALGAATVAAHLSTMNSDDSLLMMYAGTTPPCKISGVKVLDVTV